MRFQRVIVGACIGALLAGPAAAATVLRSDDGFADCQIFDKRDMKAAMKSPSRRLAGIWPTKKDPVWRSTLKKARTMFVCTSDTDCFFGFCLSTMVGAYLNSKGGPVARVSGLVGQDNSEVCWKVTINGGDAGTTCR